MNINLSKLQLGRWFLTLQSTYSLHLSSLWAKFSQDIKCIYLKRGYNRSNIKVKEKVTILWNLILRFSARFSSQENCQGTPIQLNHLKSNRTEKKTKLQKNFSYSCFSFFCTIFFLRHDNMWLVNLSHSF